MESSSSSIQEPPAAPVTEAGIQSGARIRTKIPFVTVLACAVAVLIFLTAGLADPAAQEARLRQVGYVSPELIWNGAIWGLVTSAFVHVELWHIAFNLYWLWVLGKSLELRLGALWMAGMLIASAWVSSGAELLTGEAGIGLSGVVYALFGVLWVARSRITEFRSVMPDKTSLWFLSWFVLCLWLQRIDAVAISNAAHAGGLAFGSLIGAWMARPDLRRWVGAGIASVVMLSIVPLFGVPWSANWSAAQAYRAMDAGDYESAIRWLRKSQAQGQDPTWTWHMLAQTYGYQFRVTEQNGAPRYRKEYAEALDKLRGLNAPAADQVEDMYGKATE